MAGLSSSESPLAPGVPFSQSSTGAGRLTVRDAASACAGASSGCAARPSESVSVITPAKSIPPSNVLKFIKIQLAKNGLSSFVSFRPIDWIAGPDVLTRLRICLLLHRAVAVAGITGEDELVMI